MSKLPSLRKNFVWAFGGTVVSAFCRWLLLVVLTKTATVETVGIFAIAQAVGMPVAMLLSMRLQTIQVTDTRNDFSFGHYYALKIVTSIAMVLIVSIIGFFFYPFETAIIIITWALAYAVIEVREIFLTVLLKAERLDQVAISRIAQAVLSVLFFTSLLLLSKKLVVGVLGLFIARFIVLSLYDIPMAKRHLKSLDVTEGFQFKSISAQWQWLSLWKLFLIAAPLASVAWFATLFTSVPRLILDKSFGIKEVGFFAAISSLLAASKMVMAALSQTVTPRLSKYYVENISAYKKLLLKLIGVAFGFGIVGIVISFLYGKFILALMFTPEYAQHNNVFIGIAVASAVLFIFTFMNVGLCAARSFKVQVPIYGFAAGVCVILSLWLIPSYGMIGAVVAVIASFCFGAMGCGVFVIIAIQKRTRELSTQYEDEKLRAFYPDEFTVDEES